MHLPGAAHGHSPIPDPARPASPGSQASAPRRRARPSASRRAARITACAGSSVASNKGASSSACISSSDCDSSILAVLAGHGMLAKAGIRQFRLVPDLRPGMPGDHVTLSGAPPPRPDNARSVIAPATSPMASPPADRRPGDHEPESPRRWASARRGSSRTCRAAPGGSSRDDCRAPVGCSGMGRCITGPGKGAAAARGRGGIRASMFITCSFYARMFFPSSA